jgi:NADPH-dependent 2,4-dienoyl-CoA reductase/sulfur reductase-like enzyme/rhodanese-related sulfurtransferase
MNEDAEIIVIEKGGYISFANCGLPYHLAGRIQNESDLLLTTPQKVFDRFRIDARVLEEATSIDRSAKTVTIKRLKDGSTYTLSYDKLILAPGASAIVPPIANIDAGNVTLLRTMEDMQVIRSRLSGQKPGRITIIGGGFIGLEMAEAMVEKGLKVTIVEKAPRVLPPIDPEMARFVEDELKKHGVAVYANNGLKSLIGDKSAVTQVELEDGTKIDTDLVLLSIGVRPNTTLAKAAGITIGASGAIEVDTQQRTSDPDVYAVGDVAEVIHAVHGKRTRIPLAGPANRQGRLAGEHAATDQALQTGAVLGTAIVAVFDLAVAVTGLGEKMARDNGFDVDTAYVLPNHHVGYYPGAEAMRIKLIYDKTTGKVLGGQIVGKSGVDKRIDVLATAISFGATVEQLASLDLAYAPQFGAAKDPLHMAAFVAINQRQGLSRAITAEQVNGDQLIDVRSESEYAAGSLKGAINIPVEKLRDRAGEIDANLPVTVFCQVGQRGFVAERILRQRGFVDVKNLKGGYAMAN